jgi:4-amino-4-deoxy-L-arabinose transferase-like glycosyltransferase
VLMTLFPDRKERYLLPLLGPFAILCARAIELTLAREYRGPKIPRWVQWLIIFVMGVGLPIVGATKLAPRVDGRPWYPANVAITMAVTMAAIILIGMLLSRQQPIALLGTTVLVVLLMYPLAYAGYRNAQPGRSDMRPLAEYIRATHPTAEMYRWRPDNKRVAVDLSIYLNRSTIWTRDPARLPRSDRPQIAVAVQNKNQPEIPPPPGWTMLAKVLRDQKDWYVAFVREAPRGK